MDVDVDVDGLSAEDIDDAKSLADEVARWTCLGLAHANRGFWVSASMYLYISEIVRYQFGIANMTASQRTRMSVWGWAHSDKLGDQDAEARCRVYDFISLSRLLTVYRRNGASVEVLNGTMCSCFNDLKSFKNSLTGSWGGALGNDRPFRISEWGVWDQEVVDNERAGMLLAAMGVLL